MNFSEYFDAWLYGKEGYYSRFNTIGKKGDFFTAVSVSKFFGGSIAHYLIQRIDEGFVSAHTTVCEIGGHQGYMIADMIEFIYTLRPNLLKTLKFVIIERKDEVAHAQQEYFKQAFGDEITITRIKDIKQLHVDEAFFVANEILDAFSCELFYDNKSAKVDNHTVTFTGEDAHALAYAKRYGVSKGEAPVGYESFAHDMASAAKKSEFITFDYGDFFARDDFSLRIYKDHEVLPFFDEAVNLSELFQNSDITYDVNFLHVKDMFELKGFKMVEFATQLKALEKFGLFTLLEMLLEHAGFDAYTMHVAKIKTLIDPTMMGERFKMIHFTKE